MKVIFSTERTQGVSKDIHTMVGAVRRSGVAWFELVLHVGPPDKSTWEGGGQTVAYWRTQFARLGNPDPWTVEAARIEGVPPAVIPDDVIRGLPDDARISLMWTFVDTAAAESTRRGTAESS